MKKIFIFLLLALSISFNAYSFWIWSPKTQKWKNPKYSPLATPFLQYKEAEKIFNDKNYKDAHTAFRKLLIHYPDSKEAAEAQYFIGRCLEEMGKPYQAFIEYQKVIDSYPNSQRINEVVEREYNIGEYFLNRAPKQWLGVSVYDFMDHPAVEILKKIVDKVPYSPYASKAQYKLGLLLLRLGRYDEARDAFQKVCDNYPDSEWSWPAKYQLAIATSKAAGGADYDSTAVEEATKKLAEFIQKHPEADISPAAMEQLKELRNREAKKNFEIAQFYEKQRHYKAAEIYYQVVLDRYPDSDYIEKAGTALERMKGKEK
ncbi:MAG: outer membrane protein assembly factor BamD [Candidatus Omnitrophota bacterium]|nr:outer membrane protein assembly factor BamD [Candidatus Omnitrophota bacterium]